MKILVTGGAGFIGSNFIRYMLDKYPEHEIINFDKVTYAGNLENLKDIENNPNYSFVKGDICDKNIVDELMPKVDAVVHFAAETHVDRSIMDADGFIKTDVIGTFILLDAAEKNNIKKFIQISTDEVYGEIREGSFKETDELRPRNPYAASKAAADRLAFSFFATHKLPVIITRSSNNYGPYQYPEKVIPLFITNLIEGKRVPLYGDGSNIRDWLFVLDNCEAIDFVLRKGVPGEVYNIGGESEKTNLELTKFLLKGLNRNESFIEYVKDRPGHDKRYSLNLTKIKELGWKPKHKFEDAMKQTVEWYKNNERWWKKLKNKEFNDYYRKQYQER